HTHTHTHTLPPSYKCTHTLYHQFTHTHTHFRVDLQYTLSDFFCLLFLHKKDFNQSDRLPTINLRLVLKNETLLKSSFQCSIDRVTAKSLIVIKVLMKDFPFLHIKT